MVRIRLPDGNEKSFAEAVTVLGVAQSIGTGLAKAAIAGKVGDQLVDTFYQIDEDAAVKIITDKDPEGLEIIRHSAAHLMAQAVKELYPQAQMTIGPVIEDGFYYDFAFDRPFVPEDLEKIEKKMHEIVKADFAVSRRVLSRAEAIELFKNRGENYKVEIINELPPDETITVYQQGDFIDLCRGPHVPRTSYLRAFKLTKLSGAYWRGDPKREMLQRIYGTAWADKKALQDYLNRIEEAKKRDHREIGKKMNLFHFQQEAPGMTFWHPAGWAIIREMRNYLRESQKRTGFEEVNTPQILDSSFWQHSGHWDKFRDDIFALSIEDREFAIKPMNCPCHVQIFKQGTKSYRDLPIRFSEFGTLHRNEPSGTLHGLLRVRALVQDDGHIFCTPDQIFDEVSTFIRELHKIYADFGFTDITYKLSTRPEKRIGTDAEWDQAEKTLSDALNQSGVEWVTKAGEGAFYGPKIEFTLRDCLGRSWQCGTIQLDFFMPARLGAHYIDERGMKQNPVMLHRAILGSFERFLGILLEHYAGYLPLWLAPTQVVVLTITESQNAYAQEVAEGLQKLGIRAISDLRNEKIGFKIREHTIARVPYQVVIGDREVADRTLSVRKIGAQESSEVMTLEVLSRKLQAEIASKTGA